MPNICSKASSLIDSLVPPAILPSREAGEAADVKGLNAQAHSKGPARVSASVVLRNLQGSTVNNV